MGNGSFEGTAYASDLEGQRSVQIELAEHAVVARTAAGVTLTIAYADCQIERGGANGNTWFCHSADRSVTLMCSDPAFPSALRARAPAFAREIDRLQQRAQRTSRRRFAIGLGVVAGMLALLTLGSVAVQSAGRVAVDSLPTSIDRRMGELAYQSMSLQGKELEDERVNAAVRTIVERLNRGTADEFSYRVYVHDAPITNAFALPGGVLVVYTGLLRAAESPEQVAGVLAHEIAHVQQRHGMRRIAQSLGVVAALQLLVGDVSGLAAVAVHVLRESTVNSYSRQQEREADLEAVKLMANAGIDPRALADFFQVLKHEEKGPALPVWLATHPDLSERIADIRDVAQSTPVRDAPGLGLDWADIQERIRATEGGKRGTAAPAAASGGTRLVAAQPN